MNKNVLIWLVVLFANNHIAQVLTLSCEVKEVTSSTPTREQYYDRYYGYKYKEVYQKLYSYAICQNGIIDTDFKFGFDTSVKLKYIEFDDITITTIPVHLFASLEGIEEIYLKSSGVETVQPGAFTGLPDLQQIHLQGNNITKLTAGIFNSLTKLEFVNVGNNLLDTVEEHTFLGVVNLKKLDLHNNNLSYILANTFVNLRHLEYVDLSQNFLTDITSNLFATNQLLYLNLSYNSINNISFSLLPSSLKFLNLSHNAIEEVGNFSSLLHLHQLDVSFNKISQFSTTFQNHSETASYELIELDISHNLLTNITLNSFYGLQNLTKLTIDNNLITDISIGSFHYLQSLTFLNLSNNKMEEIDFGVLGNLEQLEKLDISYNRLNTFQEGTFHALKNLRQLSMSHNFISSIDASYLIAHCLNLQVISLHSNSWDCLTLGKTIKTFEKHKVTVTQGPTKLSQHVNGISCNNNNKATIPPEFLNTPNPATEKYPSPSRSDQSTYFDFDSLNLNINKTFKDIISNINLLQDIIQNSSFHKLPDFESLDKRFRNSSFYKFFTTEFNQTDFFLYTSKLDLNKTVNQQIEYIPKQLVSPPSIKEPLTSNCMLDEVLISFKHEVTVFMILFLIVLIIVLILLALLYVRIRSQDESRSFLQRYQEKKTCCDAELELI
ncbi:hypothetical protein RI129_001965 [Pyrocoelia pectoralis]|uniref:Uncharacterized protein n=1 Tax=Pyrocoelia pectoralis TaxID=417401 RepID=A0AAN7VV03_9COLE